MKGGISIKPKVSVIIPVYNVEKYILKCLHSVIKQKDFQSFEVIIVNDGTQDRSIEKIQELIDRHANIRLINQENRGISEARNTGVRLAKGGFISFIDSDDWIEFDMISKLYEEAIRTKSEIAICNMKMIYEINSKIVGIIQHSQKNRTIINKEEAISYFFQHKIITGHLCNKIFKTDLFIENDISFPRNKIYEDFPTCFELLWHTNKIVFVDDFLYNYLQRKGSITKKLDSNMWNKIENVYFIKDFLIQRNSYDYYEKAFTSILISSLFDVFIQLQKHKKEESYQILKPKLKSELEKIKQKNNIVLTDISPSVSLKYLIMIFKGEKLIEIFLKMRSLRKRLIN